VLDDFGRKAIATMILIIVEGIRNGKLAADVTRPAQELPSDRFVMDAAATNLPGTHNSNASLY
jgi:urease gamma subunit